MNARDNDKDFRNNHLNTISRKIDNVFIKNSPYNIRITATIYKQEEEGIVRNFGCAEN